MRLLYTEETLASIEAKRPAGANRFSACQIGFLQGHTGQFDSARNMRYLGWRYVVQKAMQSGAGLALLILSNLAMSEGELDTAE